MISSPLSVAWASNRFHRCHTVATHAQDTLQNVFYFLRTAFLLLIYVLLCLIRWWDLGHEVYETFGKRPQVEQVGSPPRFSPNMTAAVLHLKVHWLKTITKYMYFVSNLLPKIHSQRGLQWSSLSCMACCCFSPDDKSHFLALAALLFPQELLT